MSMIICLPVAKGEVVADLNEQRCFEILPVWVDYPRLGPYPFLSRVVKAIRLVFGPSPEPWVPSSLVSSGLRDDVIHDARLLATVDALSEKLSPGLRDALASSLRSTVSQLALPEGGQVTIAG